MAEALKHLINAGTVRETARHLRRAWPGFDTRRFEALALDGLEALEFKARARHLAGALAHTLPEDYATAADVIEAALAPAAHDEDLGALKLGDQGLAGWAVWPLAEYVALRGLDEPVRALKTLRELTQRFTAEFAIRPFIERHPELAFEALAAWARDPNLHVRRLASEGSRPRLPWGLQLKGLIADPTPTLPLLTALQDDASEYVRRSVANHLNDIARDHPAVFAAWLEEHLPGASTQRRALLKHASRTLIKRGDARVLKAWGLGQRYKGEATLGLSRKRIVLGESLELAVTLVSSTSRAQKLVIDYAVHHVKANGTTVPKVFKGWSVELPARGSLDLRKLHAVRPISTRAYYPGRHEVDLRINGAIVARAFFDLKT
jgi:3-methyladenine DNA glycosylase AlkC